MNRWAFLPLAIALQVPNPAEEKFKKMEEALARAKTVQFRFEAETRGPLKMKMNGEVLLEGNKVFWRTKVDAGKDQFETLLVCDGTRVRTRFSDFPDPVDRPAPEKLGATVLALLTRAGISGGPNSLNLGKETDRMDPYERFKVSALALGNREKIGDTENQEISYALEAAGVRKKIGISLWLDSASLLPVRRTVKTESGVEEVTERYLDVKRDDPIEPARFEIK